ncbi:hypothetical protein [Lysobacter gummosus]
MTARKMALRSLKGPDRNNQTGALPPIVIPANAGIQGLSCENA